MPSVGASIMKDMRKTDVARQILDDAGGAEPLISQIAEGKKVSVLARECGVSTMQIMSYLRATCDASDIEAAMVSQVRARAEDLDEDAKEIDDPKKRHDARWEILKFQADKETLHYKDKVKDNSGQGITINIDWGAPSPAVVTLDAE